MTGGTASPAVTGRRFTGKVALVTGAGSGIGAAAAHRLAAEGAAVVLAGRRSQPLDAVAAAVTEAGGRAAVRTADVTIESDVRELIDFCVTAYGRLDVAFNNPPAVRSRPARPASSRTEPDGPDGHHRRDRLVRRLPAQRRDHLHHRRHAHRRRRVHRQLKTATDRRTTMRSVADAGAGGRLGDHHRPAR